MDNSSAATAPGVPGVTFREPARGVTWCHFPCNSKWPPLPLCFDGSESLLKPNHWTKNTNKCIIHTATDFEKGEVSLRSDRKDRRKASSPCSVNLWESLGRSKHSKSNCSLIALPLKDLIRSDTSVQYLDADLMDQHWFTPKRQEEFMYEEL